MILSPQHLASSEELMAFVRAGTPLVLDPVSEQQITRCREYLEGKIAQSSDPIYGINTGFGSLCDVVIGKKDLRTLQHNLLRSHACGTGAEVPSLVVKLMLLLKIKSLCKGYSGVQLSTAKQLIALYNHNLLPVVYEQGSLGASGDLAPLAHLCLPLLGESEVRHNGNKVSASEALSLHGLKPIDLGEKEGLALINGTQFMNAYGVLCIEQLKQLWVLSNLIGAVSCEAYGCRMDPFYPQSHQIRPFKGQQESARIIYRLREGSERSSEAKEQVQDPYSFRCIPQVHGAGYEVFREATRIFETELNAVTDNPNIFAKDDLILSAGNFHGQILAYHLDFCAVAASELGSISERRTYKLLDGKRGMPLFLTPNPGLHSGYMIAQYTAASIVSQNKQYCTPASADSIISSNGQEDHVSMGANAATKLYKVVNNLKTILSIELLCACQGLDFVGPQKSTPFIQEVHDWVRQYIPFRKEDTLLHNDIKAAERLIEGEMQSPQFIMRCREVAAG